MISDIFFQIALTAYTGYLAYIGLVPVGTIEATGALNGVIFTALGNFTSQISSISSIRPIFDKYKKYIQLDSDMREFDNQNNHEEIYQIKNLTFSYGNKNIFDNLNYTFLRNKKYLLIGDSGSGKSTLLKLMFGYLTTYKGDIYFNKELVTENNYVNIRNHVLYINQEAYLFNDTIRNNINLDDNYEDEKILGVLNELGMPLSIKDLDMNVGDRGANISGGQRQRIVLARGLIRNQKIIFIDEGTSAVDKLASVQIERMLLQRKDLTVILVTHNVHEETKNLFDYTLYFPESLK
ncbi:MAG: ABC transporter ATP-binding protein [Anaerococcus sp.]|nr:ABC transporter ATP-binding protein [Peptoniphilaceae bacterium]MDY2919479.1 ABC transporter ATP-binding protein [Anaerococcus sp.]